MSNYATLKAAVQAVVKSNGNKEITGTNMQSTLLDMITSLASGYLFKGVATPSTSPGTPDENVFYITGAGTFANMGTSTTVPVGSLGVFKYNGSWSSSQIKMFDGIDTLPTSNSTNLVKSGGVYCQTYDRNFENLVNLLFEKQEYTTGVSTRSGYFINSSGSGEAGADYIIHYIAKPSAGEILLFAQGVYSNSRLTAPTVQKRETLTLSAQSVDNMSFRRGAFQALIYSSSSDTKLYSAVITDIAETFTLQLLTPKYQNSIGLLFEIINGEITQKITFTQQYQVKAITPTIPAGSEILDMQGLTKVYGYNVQNGNIYQVLTTGSVTELPINYLNSINATGTLTIKYKSQMKMDMDAMYNAFANVFTKTLNMANPADFIAGKYVNSLDGKLLDNASYKATGFIPVIATHSYYLSYKHQIAWYDSSYNYLSGSPSSDTDNIQVAPAGANFIRATIGASNNSFMLADSATSVPYERYGYYLNADAIENHSITDEKISHSEDAKEKGFIRNIGSISSGDTEEYTDFPYFVKKGLAFSFYAAITSFGTLYIGKGFEKYRGRWLKITNTELAVQSYETSTSTVVTVQHGLTLSSFIKVNFLQNNDGSADVVLQTLGGQFVYTIASWNYECNYELFFKSDGSVLTDSVISASIQDITKSVWIFGDSYFGINNARVVGQLKNYGYFNYMVNGLAGLTSQSAFADLQRLLEFGTPKYIVWCLGMNDTADATFINYFNQVKDICINNDITMIGCTIPTVPERYKETISSYIRNSGVRYIDAYKAVGANSSGTWYSGYLSSDELHPTALGAQAIALQWAVDFPEVSVYCRYMDSSETPDYGGGDN